MLGLLGFLGLLELDERGEPKILNMSKVSMRFEKFSPKKTGFELIGIIELIGLLELLGFVGLLKLVEFPGLEVKTLVLR